MKNIIVTIKSKNEYSTESFFLQDVTDKHSIEYQVDCALAEICYCDEYDIINTKEVDSNYITQRTALIEEYEKITGSTAEDDFCSGNLTTCEAIKSEINLLRQEA